MHSQFVQVCQCIQAQLETMPNPTRRSPHYNSRSPVPTDPAVTKRPNGDRFTGRGWRSNAEGRGQTPELCDWALRYPRQARHPPSHAACKAPRDRQYRCTQRSCLSGCLLYTIPHCHARCILKRRSPRVSQIVADFSKRRRSGT